MIIQLESLKPEGLRFAGDLDLTDLVRDDEEVRGLGPVSVDLRVRPRAGSVIVEGSVAATVRMACSRCADEFDQPVGSAFYAEFRPRPESFDKEAVVHDEDFAASYLDAGQEELDLREVAREQLLLQIPMKPLCRPDCRGLCPRCGADWNRNECACPRAGTTDPRLAVLAELSKKMED